MKNRHPKQNQPGQGHPSQAAAPERDECRLLFQLAQLAVQREDLAQAADLLRRALSLCPGQALYLRALGEVLLDQHAYDQALEILQQSLAHDPDVAETHFHCGIAAENTGQPRLAARCYQQAIDLDPDWVEAWFNLGCLCHRLGDRSRAETAFRRIIAMKPQWGPAHLNLGSVLFESGQHEQALSCWRKALALDPHNAQVHYNLGTCFQVAGQLEKAVAAYRQGLALNPQMAKAYLNLAKCHHDSRDYQKAADTYQQALAVDPGYVQAWYNLAATRLSQGDLDAVIACYQKVIDLQPDHDAAFLNLAVALRKQERIAEAVEKCRRALDITPHFVEARAFLYQLSQHACDWSLSRKLTPALDEDTRQCLTAGRKPGESPMLSLRRHGDGQRHLEVARMWSRWVSLEIKGSPDLPRFNFKTDLRRTERIRIGYISNDFKEHAVAQQVRGVLAAHDRQRFEIFGYACNPVDGTPYQARIKQACDHFLHIDALPDAAAARRIHQDRIHILVDMMGHTRGNRLAVVALRPAPIQVGYLGFLGTCGADFIDYFISDAVATPPQQASWYTEKLVFMPHCYQANDDELPTAVPGLTRSDFGLDPRAVVLCCFNQPYKIDQAVFDAWMAILSQVPRAVLWLLNQNALATENLKQAAVRAGVKAERLIFSGALSIARHLSRLLLADLALDPFVYNGGATTSNALWAGVPVITLLGSHFVSRMSASALKAVGLDMLIAPTPEAYVRLAVELARDPQKRAALRHHLQHGRRRFPLFDTRAFTRHLEAAYARIWDCYKNGLTPESFAVQST